MSTHRLFVAQDVLDRWMVDEAVSVEGDVMTLDGNQRFRLLSAVCFTEELTGEGDPHELIGATLLLASNHAGGFITGIEMIVDGGFNAMSI